MRSGATSSVIESPFDPNRNHPTTRVLKHLAPHERRNFPNDALRQVVSEYARDGARQEEEFFADVIDAIHPGMGRPRPKPERPWWTTVPFSPLAALVRTIVRRKKRCPDCRKRVARKARVCRFCGYRFDPASDSIT